ncbi:hypothetical protein Acr_18g0005550 [Actinidia rufa]|uniref:Uncharacterized protein n=1 Tax=Actinidia rufa TaxID=165716 RepID=A0A7J0G6G9_9ERIC|nr:hypothetical protein Acr_18g0005550 [Actinidia rufa]
MTNWVYPSPNFASAKVVRYEVLKNSRLRKRGDHGWWPIVSEWEGREKGPVGLAAAVVIKALEMDCEDGCGGRRVVAGVQMCGLSHVRLLRE